MPAKNRYAYWESSSGRANLDIQTAVDHGAKQIIALDIGCCQALPLLQDFKGMMLMSQRGPGQFVPRLEYSSSSGQTTTDVASDASDSLADNHCARLRASGI